MTADECRQCRELALAEMPDGLRGVASLPAAAATILVVMALAFLTGGGIIGEDAFCLALVAYGLGLCVLPVRARLVRGLSAARGGRDVRLSVGSSGVAGDARHWSWGAFTAVSEQRGFVVLRAGARGPIEHLAIPARAFATAAARADFVTLARAAIAAPPGTGAAPAATRAAAEPATHAAATQPAAAEPHTGSAPEVEAAPLGLPRLPRLPFAAGD